MWKQETKAHFDVILVLLHKFPLSAVEINTTPIFGYVVDTVLYPSGIKLQIRQLCLLH